MQGNFVSTGPKTKRGRAADDDADGQDTRKRATDYEQQQQQLQQQRSVYFSRPLAISLLFGHHMPGWAPCMCKGLVL